MKNVPWSSIIKARVSAGDFPLPGQNAENDYNAGGFMQAVFDFISGKMPFDEFYEFYQSSPSVSAWLNQLTNNSGDLL
ncbi:MAG: hypothetical protein ACLUIC_04440 [Oscillospiraceae bacterium]